ncbi:hypothetical protein IV203_022569 [Nitzschia inconspicua]|uniref:Uncharacterized protein n=1 Tax=Nitzschia inconspicua TaxID=303405 RepID=A0A9K3PF44_9STRA|nr:hypothetical protein IV203_022569 [Nitzschia inconspicua]
MQRTKIDLVHATALSGHATLISAQAQRIASMIDMVVQECQKHTLTDYLTAAIAISTNSNMESTKWIEAKHVQQQGSSVEIDWEFNEKARSNQEANDS